MTVPFQPIGFWPDVLQQDPRVVLMERTNVRSVDPAGLEPPPNLVVADLSFVSLGSILPNLVQLADPAGARFVLQVKPQFEVDAEETERYEPVSQHSPGNVRAAVACVLEHGVGGMELRQEGKEEGRPPVRLTSPRRPPRPPAGAESSFREPGTAAGLSSP